MNDIFSTMKKSTQFVFIIAAIHLPQIIHSTTTKSVRLERRPQLGKFNKKYD